MDYAIKIVEQSGKDLTDYQIRVEITDPDFFSKCTDQKYVEFYDEDKQTLLSHYTELFDTANKIAIFWVKVPSIPANGTKYIYLNINTERTEDLSDPEAVFDFFDDFEGDSLDTNKWSFIEGSSVQVANSEVTLSGSTTSISTRLYKTFTINTVAEFKAKMSGSGATYFGFSDYDGSTANGFILVHLIYGFSVRKGSNSTTLTRHTSVSEYHAWEIRRIGSDKVEFYADGQYDNGIQDATYVPDFDLPLLLRNYGSDTLVCDWVRVRKYTEPEPSVTVIRLGATPTYELKLKIAQALAGETTTILDTDPKIRLLSGTDIIKELNLTAKTVYKDATNKRVVVAFLFVDDSSDSYTTDNQELLFTKDNVEYVAFKSDKSFTKEANKRLPLRWEIYLNYDVDVCTYEETMVTCL